MGGRLMRRTSPSTRIMGGKPADRCKSDAPCFAEKASSSVISIGFLGELFLLVQKRRAHTMSSIAVIIGSLPRRIQKATLKAGRAPDSVRLLAVSKTRPPEDLRAAFEAGQQAFGENYLQEALDKIGALEDLDGIEWYFIGPIQSNKTRQIAESFAWVHSVDRLKIARRLSEQRPESLPALNICLQVNINNEDSKSGCTRDELPELDIGRAHV